MRITVVLLALLVLGCVNKQDTESLVPGEVGSAPNYWCTWYWQNYLILGGQEVTNPDAGTVYTNQAARDQLHEETVFGEQGMARVMLPRTRSDYYFLIDHGWQDKSISNNTFFTSILDTLDFPRYSQLEPRDRIRQMNTDIKALGWKGLGLWFRGNQSREEMKKLVEWSKYAEVQYWKIDGGDTEHFYASDLKEEIYPELILEHITGAGPVNLMWNIPGLKSYPSVYSRELLESEHLLEESGISREQAGRKVENSLEVLKNTDVFRTYDAAPLLASTTTMQRVHDLLIETAGKSEYKAILNIQDDCNIAAAMGLVVAVKRHPMNTPRIYKGKDFHLQIAGDRHVDKRLNEMDRLALWQRVAPPMPAGYGTYLHSEEFLIDSIFFEVQHTWYKVTHGKMVRQSAPAIMARNIALPEVKSSGMAPYVMASKYPNGAIAVATEGRVKPENSWVEPRADVSVKEATLNTPIGIFGYYQSLSLEFENDLPGNVSILAQDLLAESSIDITAKVQINKRSISIDGRLIHEIGTRENDQGDISVPGMIVKIIER